MTRVEDIKAQVLSEIKAKKSELVNISLTLHAKPELGFKEVKASKLLCAALEKNGFEIKRGLSGLDTAFKASYGQGEPVIAFLAEYDALPHMGHACGHNIIAAASVGAGMAARRAVDEFGGRVLVIGTPGEELYGGKTILIKNNAFDGIDVAMMIHPGMRDVAMVETLACISLDVEYFGKAAHAAGQPAEGINALEALILAFSNVNSLRQHIREQSRIHGIITRGGDAPNIVPEHTAATFLVRDRSMQYLEELRERVLDCFVAAALATGTRLEYKWGEITYAPLRGNPILARLFCQSMESLGRAMSMHDPQGHFGSTDMGNISQIIPSIHPLVAIASPEISGHSQQFADAARSEAGHHGLLDGATAMALTLVELLAYPEKMAEVKEAFIHNNSHETI